MAVVHVGVGSNVDAEAMVSSGINALDDEFDQLTGSAVYRSTAVGFVGDPFLNLVCRFHTELPVAAVDQLLHRIEDRHGRRRDGPKFSSRTLDIDLLLYDDLCLSNGSLILPRDEILHYAFVLRPLAELDPDLIHPRTGTSMASLWEEFSNHRDHHGQTLETVNLPILPIKPAPEHAP